MPEIVVVGAGPAGLAAARRAAECGAAVTLLDDNPQPGGQIWRGATAQPARWLRTGIRTIAGARVFAFPAPGRLAFERAEGAAGIAYDRLVLATGARERFLPFPGWTLPNVMGAGGLQALVKGGLPVAGKQVIVAGSGPLLPAVARYLRGHGARVRLIAEQADRAALWRFGAALARHPAKLAQALRLRAATAAIPYFPACWPVAAQGDGRLELVALRQGSHMWNVPCDYLACGFGLMPNLELPALLGCDLTAARVAVDEWQQTTCPGVYAAGEATGIGGLELSLAEGEIAGYAAAGRPDLARRRFGARAAHRRFAAALDHAFALRHELQALPHDETTVCRCEDVPFGRVRRCADWREAKLHTRCGMGACQGRVCGGALEFLLGWRPDSVRPPAFPVRVASLTLRPGASRQDRPWQPCSLE